MYCEKCGEQNADSASFCNNCGASLKVEATPGKRDDGCFEPKGRPADECFGVPYGSAICILIIGLFIIGTGLSTILGFDWTTLWNTWFFPIIGVAIGLVFIIGAIYMIRRTRY
ncbi:MAG: zinc-ribbon domain-containing protein [Candidatus Ranarchaeia archaeon]